MIRAPGKYFRLYYISIMSDSSSRSIVVVLELCVVWLLWAWLLKDGILFYGAVEGIDLTTTIDSVEVSSTY